MTDWTYDDTRPLSQKLRPGDHIDGKYRVVGVLGAGASATVYEAVHEEIDTAVAVKVVHAESSNEPHHLARFRREARTCGRVRSRHVPQVYDVGRLPDGSPYMVMELLRGETLEAHVTRGPLPLGLVFEVGKQLLRALEAVHAQRAIHRDVKPENLVLEYDEHGKLIVKLVDFGISKNLDEPRNMTMEGMVLGTPHYMAPEQVEGGDLDERADVYAAGAVLYEAITGRTPFQGTTADEVMEAVQRDPVMPPCIYRDDCPFELEAIVMTAMSRNPEARFRTAMLMREALTAAETVFRTDSRPTPLVVPKRRSSEAPRAAAEKRGEEDTQPLRPLVTSYDPDEDDVRRRRPSRGWLYAAAAVALVLGGMTAFAALTGNDAPARASRAPIASPMSLAAAGGLRSGAEAEAGTSAHTLAEEGPRIADDESGIADEGSAQDPSTITDEGSETLGESAGVAEVAGDGEEAATSSAAAASVDERRPARRRARRERSTPVTTLLPAPSRTELRERVRDSMLREWPAPGDDEDPAKEQEGDPSLPSVVRTNPYAESAPPRPPSPASAPSDEAGDDSPPSRPYGEIAPRSGPYGGITPRAPTPRESAPRENLPANPF